MNYFNLRFSELFILKWFLRVSGFMLQAAFTKDSKIYKS